jgi:uncharacterized damage-inducible protein DinB
MEFETADAAMRGEMTVTFTLTDADGLAFSHPLGQLIRHVVNHSTYHRGQLATLLRTLPGTFEKRSR